MQGSDARVVEGSRDGKEPVGRHCDRVATRRVRQLPSVRRLSPLLVAGREDEEVVLVKVNEVGDIREGRLVFDDEDDSFRLVTLRCSRRRVGPDLKNVVRHGNDVQVLEYDISQHRVRSVHSHVRFLIDRPSRYVSLSTHSDDICSI